MLQECLGYQDCGIQGWEWTTGVPAHAQCGVSFGLRWGSQGFTPSAISTLWDIDPTAWTRGKASPYISLNCSRSDEHCNPCSPATPACGASPIPGSSSWAQEWHQLLPCLGPVFGKYSHPPALLGMLSGVMSMAPGFSTGLFKECSSYCGNWKCNVFTPCTADGFICHIPFCGLHGCHSANKPITFLQHYFHKARLCDV